VLTIVYILQYSVSFDMQWIRGSLNNVVQLKMSAPRNSAKMAEHGKAECHFYAECYGAKMPVLTFQIKKSFFSVKTFYKPDWHIKKE
jgi:hypothetical protein